MNGSSDKDSGHFEAAYSLETNDQTRIHYKSWADTYDHEVSEVNGYAQPRRVAEMLCKLQPDLTSRILDAGCGSGLSGVAIAKAGYTHIDGCDFSPEMLEKSLEKGCYTNLFEANLNETLRQTADSTYDIVTCVGVFSFGHVFPAACDELLRVLRKGGYLVIALNEQYWDKGDLAEKLGQLEADGTISILEKQFGEHLPGHDVNGWVIAAVKN
ncbi:MAG: methyltransferase domain-containing protein [Rhizobiaceae bacterium]